MPMNINTAICIFAYKRPAHLKLVLDALAANAPAACLPLIVYVDGARGVADQASVAETSRVAKQAIGFLSVEVRSSSENLGLYRSLTSGIGEVLSVYESIIVLEDDILTSPHFLQFMLDGLERYRDSNDVGSISGYTPPIKHDLPETFFLRGADCWGWATWRDRWALYRHDAKAMAREIRDRGLAREFDLLGNYPYLKMLKGRAAGKNNSWAICWHASCFLAGKLILYPGRSLVSNIGLDNSGEHCGPSALMTIKIFDEHSIKVQKILQVVDSEIFNTYSSHFIVADQSLNRIISLFRKVAKRIVRFILPTAKSQLRLTGPYTSYEAALAHSSGYDSPLILAKVKQAVVEVLEGKAVYERDGMAFTIRPDRLPIELILNKLAPELESIIDFGGGLGGLFLSYKDLVGKEIIKIVIEQESMARIGKILALQYSLDIAFVASVCEVASARDPCLLVVSSVLMYLPCWQAGLTNIVSKIKPKYIFVDRQAVSDLNYDTYWIQHVRNYYDINLSYPFVLMSLDLLLKFFNTHGYFLHTSGLNPLHKGTPKHCFFFFVLSESTF